MSSDTYIRVDQEVKINPLSGKHVFFEIYEWIGDGVTAELRYSDFYRQLYLNPDFLDSGVVTLGALRLRVVSRDDFSLIVARDGLKARLIKAIWPIKKWWLWVWYRLILTLAVWELATYTPGMIPGWRDIKALSWIAKKWGL